MARLRRSCAGLAVALTVGGGAAPAPLAAQPALPDSGHVTVAGRGPTTFVLVGGIMGGVASYDRLRARLLASGGRVVVVDPYGLSMDSTTVTFAVLAQRVDRALARRGIDSAVVVGHAHGAGVALRLAANAPRRVAALYPLDAGALAQNRTKVFSASFRLAPMIVRFPGGRGFVRRRIIRGLEENAGRRDWLDAPTQRAYADRLLDQLSAVVTMAGRLAAAHEPDSAAAVVARVHVPVTVLLGDAPHPAAPDAAELATLAPLGRLLHVEHLPGVGHFPHEEAPDDVAARLLAHVAAVRRP